jgi:outer membrane protein assembly factor BamE (lipoprotein component of BamABCDE complex)
MIQRSLILSCALFVASVCGCSSVSNLAPARLALIEPGKTTLDQTRQLLGAPKLTVTDTNHTLHYYVDKDPAYVSQTAAGALSTQNEFYVLFDRNGVVEKTHAHSPRVSLHNSGILGVVGGTDFNEAQIQSIRKDSTTIQEVEKMLGPATDEQLTIKGTVVYRWFYARVPKGQISGTTKTLVVEANDGDRVINFHVAEGRFKPWK